LGKTWLVWKEGRRGGKKLKANKGEVRRVCQHQSRTAQNRTVVGKTGYWMKW
jgi:hypothetical protein